MKTPLQTVQRTARPFKTRWPHAINAYAVLALGLGVVLTLSLAGCPRPTLPDTSDNTGTNDTTGTDTTTGSVADKALSFKGRAVGSVEALSSTGGLAAVEAGRKTAAFLATGAAGWLEDLNGHRLLDGDGNPYPDIQIADDGTFDLSNLPVGVDFRLMMDTDGDGKADLSCILHIPQEQTDGSGTLSGARIDPLSTLVISKLYQLLAQRGVEPGSLDISLAALIERIRDAYENLSGDAGIDQDILIQQLAGLSDDQLAALFDQVVPEAARRGMQMAEGNIALVIAKDVDSVVKAAAQILLEGGFVIADPPGGVDLSFLGNLPNVETLTFQQFQQEQMQNAADQNNPPAEGTGQTKPQPTLYRSTLAEVDRNYANNQTEKKAGGGTVFGEHVLVQIAQAYLDHKVVTLQDLYRLLVDVNVGMGVRLQYPRFNGPGMPSTDVFETPDGTGTERSMQMLFQQIHTLGLDNPDPDTFTQRQAQLRLLLQSFLDGTAEPAFEQLFAGILTERVPSIAQFAEQIRGARVHLPFSRSGPSSFYVVATADPYRDSSARAVTVDVTRGDNGQITQVTYNAAGTGKCYVQFGPSTANGMQVQLVKRATGKPLCNFRGIPEFLEIADDTIFAPVNGKRFKEAFGESGSFYPGAPALRMPNPGYDPTKPADPQTNPPTFEAYVLMTDQTSTGTPIRVNFEGGIATYDENGRYYMMFTERTQAEGLFRLVTDAGEVLLADPTNPESAIFVAANQVQGRTITPQHFDNTFGIDAPNPGYDVSGAPYYDDIDNDGVQDANEPTFDHREFLQDPGDWRTCRIDYYYRRADNGAAPSMQDVAFDAPQPQLRNGVALVPRNLKPALNAFRFGTPNVTLNLLSAFCRPEFFDGTHALNAQTKVNPFMTVALVDLAFSSIHNVDGVVDFDGPGPMPPHAELIDAYIFVPPIGDPVQLISDGFQQLAQPE